MRRTSLADPRLALPGRRRTRRGGSDASDAFSPNEARVDGLPWTIDNRLGCPGVGAFHRACSASGALRGQIGPAACQALSSVWQASLYLDCRPLSWVNCGQAAGGVASTRYMLFGSALAGVRVTISFADCSLDVQRFLGGP